MVLADTLSRLPNPENDGDIELDERIDGIDTEFEDPERHTIAIINFSPPKQDALRSQTADDPKLNALREFIHQGWPENIKELPTDLRPYWSFRDELAMESGVIFKGRQILIPDSMTADILRQLHVGHQGIEKTRRLARESVYWTKMNEDIERVCRSCTVCAKHQDANPKEPLKPHEIPSKPWQSIASDLFENNGRHYMLTVDRYSKYPLVDEMPTPVSSHAVTQKMQSYMSLFGRPDEILTDNGPQYTGQAFKVFVGKWGIKHTTSSPHYPKSNGFIERHVRHIKDIVTKTQQNKDDLHIALLQVRATPIDSKLPSPAELLFGRPVTTLLPSRADPGKERHRQHLAHRAAVMKEHHDRSCRRELPPLHPGQHVTVWNKERSTWHPAVVLQKCKEPRSYIVQTPNGNLIRRCRSHLRGPYNTQMQQTVKGIRFAEPRTLDEGQEGDQTQIAPPSGPETTAPDPKSPQPVRTRIGRAVVKPAYYRDYV